MTASITDVSFNMPSYSEVLSVMTLQAGFNSSLVIIGTSFLGIAAGTIGSFTLLRKRALMGDALAHSTLPGLALAFILSSYWGFEERNFLFLLLGAALSGVAGVITVQCMSRYTRLAEDSSIGAVLSVFFGLGVVLLGIIQSMQVSGAAGLNHFIYGQTASMRIFDAYLIGACAIFVILAAFFLQKEFSLVSFDPDFALVQGWPITKIDLMIMVLVTLVTVIGLQSVGIILVIALLIIPAAAARFWTERLSVMIFLSALIGGISAYLGAVASTLLPRFPAGAVIVLVSGIIFIISFLFAPSRGVLSGLARLLRLKLRVFNDHLFRDIYETFEKKQLDFNAFVLVNEVPYLRAMPKIKRKFVLKFVQLAGLAIILGENIRLSELGFERAKRLIRNHRLWEQYIFEFADISQSHVDYSADLAEHVLSSEVIKMIEERIAVPATKSMHPLQES